MSIGSRIRFFRNLRGMTQLTLGRLLGYGDVTADIRIANYESGRRSPKTDTIIEIADNLMVDPEAITAPNTDTMDGFMHTLFLLEDMFGIKIEEVDGTPGFVLDENHEQYSEVVHRLKEYLFQAKRYRNGHISREEYDQWRYQYVNALEAQDLAADNNKRHPDVFKCRCAHYPDKGVYIQGNIYQCKSTANGKLVMDDRGRMNLFEETVFPNFFVLL